MSKPIARVIACFGGIEPMAIQLNIPISLVKDWEQKGQIPLTYHKRILALAKKIGADRTQLKADLNHDEASQAPEASSHLETRSSSTLAAQLEPKSYHFTRITAGLACICALSALALIMIKPPSPAWLPDFFVSWGMRALGPDQRESGTAHRIMQLERQIAQLEAKDQQEQLSQLIAIENRLKNIEAEIDRSSSEESYQEIRNLIDNRADKLAQQQQSREQKIDDSLSHFSVVLRNIRDQITQQDQRFQKQVIDLRKLITALEADIQIIKEFPHHRKNLKPISLLLSTVQFDHAIRVGMPYESIQKSILTLLPPHTKLGERFDYIHRHAQSGLPTLFNLRERFQSLLPAILYEQSLEKDEDENRGLIQASLARIRALARIRPIGEHTAGDDWPARIARAEVKLNRGNLASAVDMIGDNHPPTALVNWLADARARLEAEALARDLNHLALSLLNLPSP